MGKDVHFECQIQILFVSCSIQTILWVSVSLHMKVKQKNEGGVNFLFQILPKIHSLDGWEKYEDRVLGVVASDAPNIQVPSCLRYQVSLKITGPFRSKKHWPPCKYAKSQEMATPLDCFYSPEISEAGPWTQSHPSITGNAMHFPGSTQPDQKKETSASVWHQHVFLS